MTRRNKQKKQNHGKSSSEESSQSESSESSESQSESSGSEDDRQQQRRGTQKRTTQVRKQTQRKPTQNERKQGTLTYIGKIGRSQQDIKDDDDDYNFTQQRGGARKPTQVVRGSETTAPEIKRSNQRGMTKIQAINIISNLENELVIEKTKQEQLQKEKQEQDQLVRNEVIHLNQERLLLLKKVDQKKNHIQTIQKKLEEQKQNNVDIISTKKSKREGGFFKTLSSINQFFFDNYLFSSYSYKMANYFDNKVYEHFAFLSYFINNSMLAFFILIYLLINQIVSNHSNYSNLSLFFSFTFDSNVPAFVLLCLLVLISQIVIAFIKFDKYKSKRVREIARYSSKINIFKLVISEYNWKIQNRTQLEKVQLAFQQRASFLLHVQSARTKFQQSDNDFSIYIFQIFGFVLSCGIVAGQMQDFIFFFIQMDVWLVG